MSTYPYIGHGALLALGKETDWGDAVATPEILPILSSTLDVALKIDPLKVLGHTTAHAHHGVRESALLGHDVSGEVSCYLSYDTQAMGILFEAMFGDHSTAGGSAPYTHTFVLDTSGVMNGLTGQQIMGRSTNPSITDKARTFTGLVCTSWEIIAKAREPVMVKTQWHGRLGDAIGAVTGGTLTVTDGEEVLAHHAGLINFGEAPLACTEISIKCDHKLQKRPMVGSLYSDRPAPSDFAEFEITATVEVVHDQWLVDFLAGTRADLTITFSGTGDNEFGVVGHNAQLLAAPVPVDKAGVLTAQLRWRCHADATDRGLSAWFTNANALPYS